jgi:hypothetical protein
VNCDYEWLELSSGGVQADCDCIKVHLPYPFASATDTSAPRPFIPAQRPSPLLQANYQRGEVLGPPAYEAATTCASQGPTSWSRYSDEAPMCSCYRMPANAPTTATLMRAACIARLIRNRRHIRRICAIL